MHSASRFAFLLFPLLFISCVTTRAYEKTTQQLYQDNDLIGEQSAKYYAKGKNINSNKKKLTEKNGKYSTSYDIDSIHIEAETELGKTLNSKNIKIALYHNDDLIEEREYEVKNKKVVYDSSKEKKENSTEKKYMDLIDRGDFIVVEGDSSINSFLIAKTEITRFQYSQIIGTPLIIDDKKPMDHVSFYEAIEFCNALSIRNGFKPAYIQSGNSYSLDNTSNGYRLPTVNEWQYAASGGKFKKKYKYSGSNSFDSVGWYNSNSKKKIQPVAKKQPNCLGIYDMSGNVSEWCWGEKFYACGGSYYSKKNTTIDKFYYHSTDNRYAGTGFRIVRSLSNEEQEEFLEKKNIIENLDKYFSAALNIVINSDSSFTNSEENDMKTVVYYEKAIVESTPNAQYIAYSFLGKPFVILGATVLNLLKSLGYAFINFIAGYHTVVHDDFFWLMPNVKRARERADIAKEENQIVYPEYHIPFTDNHIMIDKIIGEAGASVSVLEPNEIQVTSKEVHEYNNSLSVKLSAEKDANETASIIGLIGTIISVPVSVITWVVGAVAGLCEKGQ